MQEKRKSCEKCRRLKIRCIVYNSADGRCQRCAGRGEQCVVLSPKRRRPRRKATDVRVTELEHEVSSMRAMIAERNSFQDTSPQSRIETSFPAQQLWTSNSSNSIGVSKSPTQPTTASTAPSSSHADVIDRGLLTMQIANELYHEYRLNLAPRYPVVIFPPNYSTAQLREQQPLLFLAVLAASAINLQPPLSETLNEELRRAYAERIFILGEKSLEIVEALLVTVAFYFPPAKFAQLKFYEYIHIAAAMVNELGLSDTPQTNSSRGSTHGTPQSNITDSPSEILQHKRRYRSLLASYINCCGSSLAMRRINMLPFNDCISECADTLLTLADVQMSDRRLVAWVRLMAVAEAYAVASSSQSNPSKPQGAQKQAQATYRAFRVRLDEWERSVTDLEWNAELRITHNYVRVLFCEPFLSPEHPCIGFRPPFPMTIHRPEAHEWGADSPPVGILCDCIIALHALFDTFLAADINLMPAHVIARVGYAAVVLTRLQISAQDPKSRLGRAMESGDLNLDYYSTSLIAKLKEASGSWHHVLRTFLGGQIRLRQWYLHYLQRDHEGDDEWNEVFTLYASKANHPVLSVLVEEAVSPRTSHSTNGTSPDDRTTLHTGTTSTTPAHLEPASSGDATMLTSEQHFNPTGAEYCESTYSSEFIEQCSITDLDALMANWGSWESDYDHFGLASTANGPYWDSNVTL